MMPVGAGTRGRRAGLQHPARVRQLHVHRLQAQMLSAEDCCCQLDLGWYVRWRAACCKQDCMLKLHLVPDQDA